jgi:two-component system LytT family response regulator
MNKLKALIVEDEEASRITLRNYLGKYCPTIELLGEASNVDEAYKLIIRQKPDVIFLDVEMPYGNAFDLLEKFDQLDFEVIFVTAFSKYALEALNLSASNYLLKPVNIEQLIEAVDKVQQQISDHKAIKTSNILLENLAIENKQLKKMVLPMLDGFEVVQLKDIVWCNANDNLTDLHLLDGSKRTVCRTLKFYENVLTDYNFIRIHKSHMININYVKLYRKGKGGEITLDNGVSLKLSPTRKSNFLERFV